MMTSGAQEGLSKAVNMCMNRGDPVIMPDPVYTGALDLVRPTPSIAENSTFSIIQYNYRSDRDLSCDWIAYIETYG